MTRPMTATAGGSTRRGFPTDSGAVSGPRAASQDAGGGRFPAVAAPVSDRNSRTDLRLRVLAIALGAALFSPICPAQDSPPLTPQEETRLIQTLRSEAPVDQKLAACALLKRSTTPEAIDALAAQLGNATLSHPARYALETLPPPAGAALISALDRVSESEKVGIIQSLAARREAAALPGLKSLLQDSAPMVEAASARALGQIGGKEAAQALSQVLAEAKGSARAAMADALLMVADGFLTSGDSASAGQWFGSLRDSDLPDHVRQAAFRGVVQASGPQGVMLIAKALTASTGPDQVAAMQLVRTFEGPRATETFASLLPELNPAGQAALLGQLAQRDDPAAAPAAVSLLQSQDVEVRVAALNALAVLGDASLISRLGQIAAESRGPEQAAARSALTRIAAPGAGEEMATGLVKAAPAVRAEYARALAERRETQASGTLFKVAEGEDESAAIASLQALGLLIDEGQLPRLLKAAAQAASERQGQAATEAVQTAVQRFHRQGTLDVKQLLEGISRAQPAGQARLMPVLSGLAHPDVRAFFRLAARSSDPVIRGASVRALCDSLDPELLADITAVAVATSEPQVRRLALAGVARLWAQDDPAPPMGQRLSSAEKIFAFDLSDDEHRLLLAGLAQIYDPQAIRHAERTLAVEGLRNESARALIGIASALGDPEVSEATLTKVLETPTDEQTRAAASVALQQVRARAAHVTLWEAAGPFRQAGKDYAALFEVPFPPEDQSQWGEVQWTRMATPSTPAHPYALDLLKMYGGEQCVAYARTRIHCSGQQPVALEMASDDGIKAWVNGKLVHANNTARPWEAGIDKAKAELQPGWNTLLLKVTQNNLGWEFSVRVVTPEGTTVPGFKTSVEGW